MRSSGQQRLNYWQSANPTFNIVGTKNVFAEYTVYIIEAIDHPVKWMVERRWSAFEELYEDVCTHILYSIFSSIFSSTHF